MREVIIGIDPGTHKLGVALITGDGKLLHSETISVSRNESKITRIAYIKGKLRSLIRHALFSADYGYVRIYKVLYEEPHGRNSRVAKVLSEVIGAITLDIYEKFGIEAEPVNPTKARALVGLNKKSSKQDIKNKVEEIIGKNQFSQHEADAILIALMGGSVNGKS